MPYKYFVLFSETDKTLVRQINDFPMMVLTDMLKGEKYQIEKKLDSTAILANVNMYIHLFTK